MKGLEGLIVAVTGSRRASELAHVIESMGGKAYIAPTVGIETDLQTSGAEALIRNVIDGKVDFCVFMTGPGTFGVMGLAEKLVLKDEFVRALNQIKIVARSPKPKVALEKHGVKVDIMPEDTHDNTAEGIAKAMARLDLSGKKVAILCHGAMDSFLRSALEAKGASVQEAQVYVYGLSLTEGGASILGKMGFQYLSPEEQRIVELIRDLVAGKIDAITFTSPPSARNLFAVAIAHDLKDDLVKAMNAKTIVVAVGMPTRNEIGKHGANVDVMPDVYKMGPMMKALVDYVNVNPELRNKGKL